MTAAHPESRAIHRTAVEALVQAGVVNESTSAMARRITSLWPGDPQAWALLARVEAARGKRALQHAASAEQYALVGAYAAAIDQLTLARRSADADFVTLSKIDARITTLRAELRREQLERKESERRREPDR
jgi:predicted Zn-dependent protease